MFKFWKSPKSTSSPNSSAGSPAARPPSSTSNSVNNPSRQAVTGLGISDDTGDIASNVTQLESEPARREGSATRRVLLESPRDGPSHSANEETSHGPRRDSTTQNVTFVDDLGKGTKSINNNSRLSVATARGNRSENGSHDHHQIRSLSPTLAGGGGGTARAVSPMSFSPSIASTFHNPYGPSVSALSERDPNQIYAPTTWSDMAHQELVVNLSARERTRQEILWEVVASEERYVVELRSLIEHYTNPMLHPLLSASPPLSSPPLHSTSFARQSIAATTSSAELPIAARFSRSTPSSASSSSLDHLPEIRLNEQQHRSNSSSSSPHLRSAPQSRIGSPEISSANTSGVTSKLASFAFGRSRQQSATSPKPSSSTREPIPLVPPLPGALRTILEATLEMLKGHEELSAKLKDQWTKSFPLVRGLGATWSDQPWFLKTYSNYIVSLEEALDIIDSHLPSAHPQSSPSASSRSHLRFRSTEAKRQDKLDQRLARYLQYLEKEAGDAGESSLSICLSKPLMRLSKLPLLMQALLFHTDPTTHEWEKTRAMALEVDALVRSIEDEKIEEEQRERTRDVLARIDGINDRGLMMPRSSRVLISEQPAPPPSSSSNRKNSMKRSSRRVSSGPPGTFGRSTKSDKEWLISFTDVVIRAQKVGETNVPGSFSREKEKQGRQGKTRKNGPLRNTYRFLHVERWETLEKAEAALSEIQEQSTGTVDESDTEETFGYAESRMSFRYDSDEPQPTSPPRDFTNALKKNVKSGTTCTGRRSISTPVPDTAKFGGRLRLGSEEAPAIRSPTPGNRHRFDSPTLSSTRKAHTAAAQSQRAERRPPPVDEKLSRNEPVPPAFQCHSRDESTYNLYKMWSSTQE